MSESCVVCGFEPQDDEPGLKDGKWCSATCYDKSQPDSSHFKREISMVRKELEAALEEVDDNRVRKALNRLQDLEEAGRW